MRARIGIVLTALLLGPSTAGASDRRPAAPPPSKPRPNADKPLTHPAAGDRVVILHERREATHVVATRRPEDLRSKEILVGDGVAVSDVSAFFRSARVRLAAIPVGTNGVVLATLEPWKSGNELPAVRVRITSGPLEGQEWWVSVPGVAARKTPDGDLRIRQWQAEVRAGRRKDPKSLRVYEALQAAPAPPR